MSDIIHLLPDSVANQIAAGEVIQRPASVIKELVENAVDAGATTIQIVLKDAGRTLIQVIDNGKGMSPTDARLAFERHSTSKIRSAEDLFTLHTMGFRGEALASIAAIAQVELRTRRSEDEVGTCVRMSASHCEGQESISTPVGSNFAVKNIFFNVAARRKFLKSNQVELSNILGEFERMALINTQVAFTLTHNDTELFNLPASNLRQRIVALFGKSLNQQLLALDTETSLVKISGYVGRPESARKRGALQYFFVNGRYMRHPYFHKAVTICYEHLVPVGEMPNYFINLTVEPETIDVNIHPTKSEIKFENEQPIWQILSASVKEALGKYSAAPTIDFDMDDAPEIPISKPGSHVAPPTVQIDKSYNPFRPGGGGGGAAAKRPQYDWQQLYSSFNNSPREEEPLRPDAGEEVPSKADFSGDYVSKLSDDTPVENNTIFPEFESKLNQSGRPVLQLKGRYITVPTPDGLMVVDQHRAHGVAAHSLPRDDAAHRVAGCRATFDLERADRLGIRLGRHGAEQLFGQCRTGRRRGGRCLRPDWADDCHRLGEGARCESLVAAAYRLDFGRSRRRAGGADPLEGGDVDPRRRFPGPQNPPLYACGEECVCCHLV